MSKLYCFVLTVIFVNASFAQTPDTVFLEELTWTEVRTAIDSGTTTIIVPTAGTEQNGPHMALGKHNFRMKAGAERLARALGNTLVAPIMAYVPEGDIAPPSDHMRYAGTISIPQDVFRSVLEATARSLKAHGFTDVLFIGDSGPNQAGMQQVSEELNQEWDSEKARVHFVSEWYSAGGAQVREYLKAQGETDETIGTHAGLSDTSFLLATTPEAVRENSMSKGRGRDIDGVTGDPTNATSELGNILYDILFEAALSQIREQLAR